jgi:formate hydrogenlyase subunit 6/NADH:ubiquinone oxidoreductase subunit I
MLLMDVVKSWFSRASTKRYPKGKEKPENYRGKILWDDKKCTRCLKCVQNCPAYAIKLKRRKAHERGRIEINFGKCVFCYYCVDNCSVKALKGTTEFELATDDRTELEGS